MTLCSVDLPAVATKSPAVSRYKLTIDLAAVAHNWRQLNALSGSAICSAVVKADAYGLGAVQVVHRLYEEGCRDFFVATLDEALALRAGLNVRPKIYVLSGIFPGEERICIENELIPTLVSLEMLERWVAVASGSGAVSALKIDTGMGRLGLSESELDSVLCRPGVLLEAGVDLVLSHLACADSPVHPLNAQQLHRFKCYRERLSTIYPDLRFSLANSAGCALGTDFHFDMVRPGVSLYGSQVADPRVIDIQSALTLALSVIQFRHLNKGESAGYGADFVAPRDSCLAVVAGGYADGIFKALSKGSTVYVDGKPAPIVGRVSMDSILVDVTDLGLDTVTENNWPCVELLGADQGVDKLAKSAGLVSYEILTSLGQRFERVYRNGDG